MAEERVAIGIAFGNTNSSIAYTNPEGKVEVIANEEGDRQIPTILSYVDGEEVHGTQAKAQFVRNAKNTVAYFRDFLGQPFKAIDPTPCHQSARPKEDGEGISFELEEKNVAVLELATRYLKRLRSSATDFLGKEVNAAVIGVPTNFSDAQKEALKQVVKNAGMEPLQMITEPVAALLAHDSRGEEAEVADKYIVVADFGGIRSDVAVISSREGIYSTLATVHDFDVTGAQLDQVLMDYFATEFKKKHKDAGDPRKNDRSMAKLKLESEAVKKALSRSSSATFSVESLSSAIDFSCSINQSRYELKATKVFAAMSRLVQSAVNKAGLDPLDIDEIVLVGGVSYTPRVLSSLRLSFPDSVKIFSHVNALEPAELIARGAAIQASLIADFDQEDIEESCHAVVTVTPHIQNAIGVMVAGANSQFIPLILPFTPVPVRRTATFAAPKEGGTVSVVVCEGERHIKVTAAPPRAKKEDDSDDSDSDEGDAQDEETRSKEWKQGKKIAQAIVRDIKKGGQVEVQINVGPDLGVTVIAREVGQKGGVRLTI